MGKFHFFSTCPFRDAIVKLSLLTENWLQVKHEAFFVINYCNCAHTVVIFSLQNIIYYYCYLQCNLSSKFGIFL